MALDVSFGQLPFLYAARRMVEGFFFLGLIAYGVLGIFWVIRQRLLKTAVSPSLAASAFMALPYAHFAYSRADVPHLAQGAFPFSWAVCFCWRTGRRESNGPWLQRSVAQASWSRRPCIRVGNAARTRLASMSISPAAGSGSILGPPPMSRC